MSKLGEICKISSSKRIFENEYQESGVPFIRGQEISDGSLLSNSCFNCYIAKERFNEIKNKYGVPKKGDILITAVGTIGNVCFLNKDIDFYFKDGNVLWIKNFSDNVVPEYLYFYLKSPFFKKTIGHSLIGAVQKALTMQMLSEIDIQLPPIEYQKSVVTILKSIEDKISNNNKINAELESLAKTIYDYWFLQFEFPNEEGKPYKSSGGKIVWNEDLKREIPEGWAVKKLNSIANLYQPEILPSNLMKEDGKYFVYGANGIVGRYNKFNHEHPEIAICCRGASCGNYLMTLPKSWITGNSMVVTPKDSSVTKEYLYHSLRYIDIKRYVTGSAQPQITRSNLDGIKVVIPPFKSLEHFSNKAEKIRNELIKNINENNELSSLRDFLLPMLMNGQVQFK